MCNLQQGNYFTYVYSYHSRKVHLHSKIYEQSMVEFSPHTRTLAWGLLAFWRRHGSYMFQPFTSKQFWSRRWSYFILNLGVFWSHARPYLVAIIHKLSGKPSVGVLVNFVEFCGLLHQLHTGNVIWNAVRRTVFVNNPRQKLFNAFTYLSNVNDDAAGMVGYKSNSEASLANTLDVYNNSIANKYHTKPISNIRMRKPFRVRRSKSFTLFTNNC